MPTLQLDDASRCAEAIVDRVGRDIKLAVPIGIGKPVLIVNALYRLAEADRRLRLTIFTGLTLTRPQARTLPERRFTAPLLERLFATYPEPLYVAALREDRLAPNVALNEFFLQAGAWLGNGPAQRNYISLNYAHVARHLARVGTNVFAQLVAPHADGDDHRMPCAAPASSTPTCRTCRERRKSSAHSSIFWWTPRVPRTRSLRPPRSRCRSSTTRWPCTRRR